MAAMTNMVTKALSGAASTERPSGTSVSMSKTVVMTVTGISMITVPVTVGVRIRRNSESRAERANWKSDEMTTRVASIAGPPSATAVMQTAMKTGEPVITSAYPAPTRPSRTACSTVTAPPSTIAVNTAHERR